MDPTQDAAPDTLPATLVIAGDEIPITPLRVGEIPKVLALLRPCAGRLSAFDIDWMAIIETDAPALLGAIAIACRRPLDWVEGLLPDEAVRLGGALLEVNATFFGERLAPELDRVSKILWRNPPGGIAGS